MSVIGNAVTFDGGEPKLLWTNSTSTFAAQTLSLSTGYSAYIVEIKAASNVSNYIQMYMPFSEVQKKIILQSGSPQYYRHVNSVTDGAIEFSTGYSTTSGSGTSYAIPTRIWGVKWTL